MTKGGDVVVVVSYDVEYKKKKGRNGTAVVPAVTITQQQRQCSIEAASSSSGRRGVYYTQNVARSRRPTRSIGQWIDSLRQPLRSLFQMSS